LCSQDQSFEKLRKVYEISRILNDVVDALLKEAEPGDASRLQDTDVSSFQLANVSLKMLFFYFYFDNRLLIRKLEVVGY